MRKGILFFALLFSIIAFGQFRTENLVDFSLLKVSNGIHLELINSDKNIIEISGEKTDKVAIKNTNNTLKLSLIFPEVTADGKVKVKIFYNKSITEIDATKRSKVRISNLNQDDLEITASERAFIDISAKIKKLKVISSSGGIVKLTGTTNTQEIATDLYGIYNGFEMIGSESSTVFAGTGSKVEITPGKKITVKINFGGSVFYKGEPELIEDGDVSGGIIKKRN